VIRNDDHPLDLEGNKPVWNQSIEALVAGFKDEAVDMAIQLYRRESPLEAGQAESIFLGMQSVLLHLLDHQRFTEGHLLASWLRPQIEDSRVLQDFRNGYTFDKICALLAEPAGQPQTSIRWNKHAEARVREQSGRLPATVDAALLIAARLEMRSRRNQAHQLSGDTRGRLVQLARREEQRQRHLEAAEAFLMLGMSLPPGDAQRLEFLTEAASCGKKAGLPYYAGVLAREKTARNPIGRQ
jgi:hypothetical protein